VLPIFTVVSRSLMRAYSGQMGRKAHEVSGVLHL
jgi:hypothetical protein